MRFQQIYTKLRLKEEPPKQHAVKFLIEILDYPVLQANQTVTEYSLQLLTQNKP